MDGCTGIGMVCLGKGDQGLQLLFHGDLAGLEGILYQFALVIQSHEIINGDFCITCRSIFLNLELHNHGITIVIAIGEVVVFPKNLVLDGPDADIVHAALGHLHPFQTSCIILDAIVIHHDTGIVFDCNSNGDFLTGLACGGGNAKCRHFFRTGRHWKHGKNHDQCQYHCKDSL